MAQTAPLPSGGDNSLEQGFADYAEKAHPEIFDDLPPEERPASTKLPREAPPAETTPETPAEVPVETKPETAEEVRFQFDTLDDLAKQLEVPIDALLALKTNTKVDQVEGAYTLADVIKGFQLDQHNQNKSKSLSEAQAKVDAMRQQYEVYNAQGKQQIDTLNALGKYAKEVLIPAQFKDVNWQWLQMNDPTQYMIQRQNYSDLMTSADAYLAQVTQQSQHQLSQLDNQRKAQMEETLRNRASIRSEWADEGVFTKDTQAIREVALTNGFKAEELPILLTNPAYLKMADMATRWANLQKQKPEVTNRVKTAPKLVTATSRTGTVKPSTMTNLKAQLRANPKDADTQEAAFAQWAEEAKGSGLL